MVTDRLVNLRDVASASPLLRPGVLLRSDAPLATDVHEGYDVAWPPGAILDLRDPRERGGDPHPLATVCQVVDLPLLGSAPYGEDGRPPELEQIYLSLLTSPESAGLLLEAVGAIATLPAPVLVHCTAGKDRTGTAVALTLRLLGVSREDVLADYLRTADAMHLVLDRMTRTLLAGLTPEQIAGLPAALHATPAEAMEAFLDALEDAGGAEGWFLAQGGSPATLEALRARLLA